MFLYDKPFCKDGSKCSVFTRFVHNNDYDLDDMKHCSNEFHPGRRCGMTIEENFQSKKFISAYQHCSKPRAHQRSQIFGEEKSTPMILVKKLKRMDSKEL